MSIATLVSQLSQEGTPFPTKQLAILSNVERSDLAEFEAAWPSVPDARRRETVRTLVDLAEDDVRLNYDDVLMVALDDTDEEVRIRAIEGLWESRRLGLIDRYLEMFEHDPSEAVRAAAATALGRFEMDAELDDSLARKTARVEDSLIFTVQDPNAPDLVRRRALEAVSFRSLPEIPDLILSSHRSRSRNLRIGALYAMGRSCDERWLPELLSQLDSDDAEFRYEAVAALGEIEAQSSATAIVTMLEDEDTDVRLAAITALGKIGGQHAKNALRYLAKGDDDVLADAAEEALTEMSFAENPMGIG